MHTLRQLHRFEKPCLFLLNSFQGLKWSCKAALTRHYSVIIKFKSVQFKL